MFSLYIFPVLVSSLLAAGEARDTKDTKWSARVWQSAGDNPVPSDFPELADENVMSRPNTGIAFTGGGSRSYLASTGYMAALHELGLVENIRYISGISGGSWFTLSYTFSQEDVDDSILLGTITDPGDFTTEGLKAMDPQCMRRVTSGNYVPSMLEEMKTDHVGAGEAWVNALQRVYLDPLGIPALTPVAWSEAHLDNIRSRNPALQDRAFLLPVHASRPFPLVGSTLVGPDEGAPYTVGDSANRNFSMLEMSPLYTGALNTRDVEYDYTHGLTHTVRVGGAVESFAFSRSLDRHEPSRSGLSPDETAAGVLVPSVSRENTLDVAHMGGASSFAIGAFMDTLPYHIPTNTSLHMSYWAPADPHPIAQDTLFADGGCYENILVTSMLQRRVEKLVLFFNVHQVLQPASKWNVYEDPPSKTQVARDLSAFFGVVPEDYSEWEKRGFDLSHNQVWSTEDWPVLVTALQEAQAKGGGVIATMNLTTVGNKWYGIPAGVVTQVTFVYLSRLFEWEAQLPEDMHDLFVPTDPQEAADPSVTVSEGPFRSFPNYPTICAGENAERANALGSIAGWTVRQHADLFRSILS